MTLVLPPLEGLNEADVREEIITPLLHALGYRSGTNATIIREQSLRYPRAFLGRKDLARDPPLRGRADYILEVDARVRWTIEAKPPTSAISLDDIEQAYSYACHPEVRAVLFCLINGSELRIYQTDHGPNAPPILGVAYAELPSAIGRLANVLGPEALLRDHPRVVPDLGEPIGPGLRSVVRVVGGFAEFTRSTPHVPLLVELTLSFIEGAVERDEAGQLVAYLQSRSPLRSANQLNERLGLNRLELVSPHRVLSTSPTSPTVFRQELDVVLPAGESLPNLMGAGHVTLPRNVQCNSVTVASGVLTKARFAGDFSQVYNYAGLPNVPGRLSISASGRFEIFLA